MNRALDQVDVAGPCGNQDMRSLAATIAKRAHFTGLIAHDQRPFEAEVDAEKISRTRNSRLMRDELPRILEQCLPFHRIHAGAAGYPPRPPRLPPPHTRLARRVDTIPGNIAQIRQ